MPADARWQFAARHHVARRHRLDKRKCQQLRKRRFSFWL